MYSAEIEKLLKSKGIHLGDRVRVTATQGEFDGILMPRPQNGDQDILVIKMVSTGYNMGIRATTIELVEKGAGGVKSTSADVSGSRPETRDSKPEAENSKPGDIAILGCGGTIASRIEYKTGAVYPSITPKELRASFPALDRWPIHSRQIFSLFSEDMGIPHWQLLANEIESEIKDGANGVVVMHGTDTMSYTSAAIAFMLQKLPVPIVFVGSQRSSDRPSSDNDMNLMNAVFSATQNLGESVVCMHASGNDDVCHIHRGVRVRKMHTSRRDAFRSIDSNPLFVSDFRSDCFESTQSSLELPPFKRAKKGELKASKNLSDNVALVYTYPGIQPSLISKLDSCDGVVLAGTGLGHIPTNSFQDKTVKSIYEPVKSLIDSGIPLVMAPQTIYGRLNLRVYATGRMLLDAGVIGDGADWTPETAYVKLCWVLGQNAKNGGTGKGVGRASGMKKIAEMMMTNFVGEISERSVISETAGTLETTESVQNPEPKIHSGEVK